MNIKKYILCLFLGHAWEESAEQPGYYRTMRKNWECKKCDSKKTTKWNDLA